ncbi:MAG TPA: carboxypeptidase regulatory-like domain-containing protein [Planctomycetota bacterium]
MITTSSSGISRLLRVLAVLQGIAIIVVAVMLLGADVPVPANASAAPAPLLPEASSPMHGAAAAPPTPAAKHADAAPPREQAPATDAAPARDAVGTILYGRVVDDGGQPIPEGWVWLFRPGEVRELTTIAMSPRQPCFAISGLAPGDITFRTRATGYKESSGTITIPAGVRRLRRDFVLAKSWQLTVKILTPDGKPMRTALAELAKERPMLQRVEVGAIATAAKPETDFPLTGNRDVTGGLARWRDAGQEALWGDGKQMPKDVAGVLELDGKQPVWVSAVLRHRVLASARVEPGQAEVTLTLAVDQVLRDLGTIRGRIVDAATKEPVTLARVGFSDWQSSGPGDKADEQGRFEVRDLRPGLLTISVTGAKRSAPPCGLVALEPGQVLDLGDVPLAEYRTIMGRCEGITGKVESCRLAYLCLDQPPHRSLRPNSSSTRLEADGTFKLYLIDGRYRLRASGAGSAVMDIDTRTLLEGPVVMQLAKEANLRIDVQSNGEPLGLAVFDAGGREVYRRDLHHGWKFSEAFLLGDYRIELKDSRGRIHTRRVALGDGGADLRVP